MRGLGLFVIGASALIAGIGEAAPRPQLRTFVAEYCSDCHDGDEKRAGLDLESLSLEDVDRHPDAWERVVRKLAAGQMPPAKKKRPSAGTYAKILRELETDLDRDN